jgi:hypothetical protein
MFALLACAKAPPERSIDPAPPPVAEQPAAPDLEALFAGPPGEGIRRCRSRDPDVAFVSASYTGGPVPAPGMLVYHAWWFVAGDLVFAEASRADEPGDPTTPTLQLRNAAVLAPEVPGAPATTTRESGVLGWSDGRPVLGDQARLEVTWTCERTAYPARP